MLICSYIYYQRIWDNIETTSWSDYYVICLILAVKIMDEDSNWNADLEKRLKLVGVYLDHVNDKETKILKLLNFDLFISSAQYSEAFQLFESLEY